ncbi:MAG: sigma-54-dependent Fis family transcriptional regulator [Gammaproteobacteria bacterium]|nr:sigma-54-dependent Fis family transcriptional regulator [Gammaproteobacteria bacterium]NIR84248.1 sigma-54-dependent Fis family transcriptional regulator [Gammaproteobacteria bacterium]NIR89718.1 sigma-54-dependent Fis family transcriptional regulator [Gammaproteobacteria bacterium]NIU05406.1 sigma-54-dependent Fis family transcriptional regulator [Gammaproteobacteria bacterium]NIV52352.1 response regulator [Gammaproteobacteria bacterium]
MSRRLALIVDDEPDIRELLDITLGRMDIDTVPAASLREAREALNAHAFDLCLADMRLPDGDGLDLVRLMQREYPQTPVAMITAHGNVESAVEALKNGAFDFVSKPVDLRILRNLVSTALKLSGEHPASRSAQLIGGSPAMQHTRAKIRKLARSQAPIHISGESGTGKELAARMIHEQGPRADKGFVPVNCGAIPEELMESEFFGHKKGSFTGAHADKLGLFQAADGGTLFLDEVAELPLHMQVKLLRAIQEKSVRPVGANKEVAVDVRILSASHRDLSEMASAGRFRQDLFYRLHVIELRVPALRERPEDIPQLAEHILGRLAEQAGTDPPALAPEAVQALQGYAFQGNVRELENILERAMTLCEGHTVHAGDLGILDRTQPAAKDSKAPSEDLGSVMESVEKEAILSALERTRWNKTAAARLLGISFGALRYRMQKLGLD